MKNIELLGRADIARKRTESRPPLLAVEENLGKRSFIMNKAAISIDLVKTLYNL